MKKRISGRSDDAKKPSESQEQCASPEDLPCIRCGYNLRELSPDGRCPECGTPIHRSIHGDLLSAADPAWLTRVSRGLTLVYAALVTWLASIVLLLLLLIFVIFGDAISPAAIVAAILASLGLLAAVILLLLGIFGLTTPDPRLTLTEQPIVLRRIARGAAIAALLLLTLDLLLTLGLLLTLDNVSGFLETAGRQEASLLHSITSWASDCALAFTLVAGSFCLARLGERIPDMKLAKRTRSRGRRFAVCCVIFILIIPVFKLINPGSPGQPSWILGGVAIIVVYGTYIYAILLVWLWSKYRKPIKRCLLEARKMGAS